MTPQTAAALRALEQECREIAATKSHAPNHFRLQRAMLNCADKIAAVLTQEGVDDAVSSADFNQRRGYIHAGSPCPVCRSGRIGESMGQLRCANCGWLGRALTKAEFPLSFPCSRCGQVPAGDCIVAVGASAASTDEQVRAKLLELGWRPPTEPRAAEGAGNTWCVQLIGWKQP